MASCLKAIWSWRFHRVVFRSAQLLFFSALIYELVNQREVAAWTYHHSNKTYSWNDSREFCQKYYTDLVAIQNKNEITYLNDVLPRHSSYYWIGIRKINNNWTWVGTKKTLTKEAENWADNEPNNKGNNQDCVEIYIKSPRAPGKWNDEPCWKRKRALCYTASCQDTSCSKQGECIETIGSYTCSCYPGFYGPECEYVTECGEFDLPQHVLMNCSHPLGNFSFNSECSFRCPEGFKLNGPSKLECLASGMWTNYPPQCVAVQCPPLKTPERGNMTCVHAAKAFQLPSSCSFSCEEGFALVGPDVVQCTASGVWTASAPVCKAVQCQRLEAPSQGTMDCVHPLAAFAYGSSCKFECEAGYRVRGWDTLNCTGPGQWTGPLPACEALQCQDLAPNKAHVNCSHPFGAFRYQSTCSLTCDEGFLLVGEHELQCLDTGHWSAPLPECRAITCTPLPSPRNGTMTCVRPLGDSSYKSTCQFTCDEGFSLSGPERLDCTPSGHWTGSPPMCEAIKCPELFAPEWGSLDCSDTHGEFNVGSTCHFSCNKGFRLEGPNNVECTASGRWTALPPTCEAVKCSKLHAIEPVAMNCSNPWGNFSYESTCSFHCPDGQLLNGSASTACQESGQWSATMPNCQAGPLTIQEALTYMGGAVASAIGLVMGGTLLVLLRKRFKQKDDGKSPLTAQSDLGTYGVFTNAAFDPSS
ncbi:P-selectin isoform X6 [Equus przewalskii]|uniref:p-selectin n=1 Tax=Equus przewalskii TaxID=9798 RepID=A0ABM4M471_EQUPR